MDPVQANCDHLYDRIDSTGSRGEKFSTTLNYETVFIGAQMDGVVVRQRGHLAVGLLLGGVYLGPRTVQS